MSRWLLPLALVPVSLFAADPFAGTWKVDLGRIELPTKVEKFELNKGMYSCSTCVPAVSVKADGTVQKITGANTYDAMSIKVVDARTIEETDKKGGRTVEVDRTTVSPDGSHISIKFTQYPENSARPVSGEETFMRVEKGPAGAHAISGGWRAEKLGAVSDNGLTMTIGSTADGLSYTNPTGESWSAKFDGKDYPVKGDAGIDMVSVKRIDANTVEVTNKKNGKVVSVTRTVISADGRTGNVTSDNKLDAASIKYKIVKQ